VPLKTSALSPPLSVVRVTTMPVGDVRVMSRSAGKVWVIAVITSKS
jgi:hypothetical protein